MNEPKSARYHRLHRRAGCATVIVIAALLSTLMLTGGSVALREFARDSVAAYALLLILGLQGATFPLAWHGTFALGRDYGLSTASPRLWFRAYSKGGLLTLAVAAAGSEALYAAIRTWPEGWWFATATGGALLTGLLTSAAPVLLVQLQRGCMPTATDGLRRRLVGLSRRAGVDVIDVCVWAGGEEVRRARATLVGAGATRRILVTTTLVTDYSEEEIEVVLAHEIGHHVHRDIPKALAAEALVLLAGCFAAALVLRAVWRPLGLAGPSDVAGLPVLLLVFGGIWLGAAPLRHALSRKAERRADRFALELTGRPDAFVGAVRRMAAQNLLEERPTRGSLWLFHTHPSVEERIRVARERADCN